MARWARTVLPLALSAPGTTALDLGTSRPSSALSALLTQASLRGEETGTASSEDAIIAHAVEEAARVAQDAMDETHSPLDMASLVGNEEEETAPHTRVSVWVTGFPRSGSSTTLSLVKAVSGNTDSQAPGQVFSLFEPCHEGDELDPWLRAEGCSGLLTHVAKCDFGGVTRLWGWPQPHTTNNHTMEFSKAVAASFCDKSDVIAFKTVDYGHDLSQFLWLLDSAPSMRIVATVRDPRGIYASWKTTKPFKGLLKRRWLCGTCPGGLFYNLTQICDAYAANLNLDDNRIHTIVFEELLQRPVKTTKRAYEFLGMRFGQAQMEWINRTFDASNCPEEPTWHQGFADCHTKSASQNEAWRSVLDAKEIDMFNSHANCVRVAEAYGYALN